MRTTPTQRHRTSCPLARFGAWGLLLALVAGVALAAPLTAQVSSSGVNVPPLTPEQEEAAQAVMGQLRSPFAGFMTVQNCPMAGALRDSIRVMAAAGMSTHDIVEFEVARHGEESRLLPKKSGKGLLAWVMPLLVLTVGAAVVVHRLRRSRGIALEFPAPTSRISDEERARLATALQEWEDSAGKGVEP